MATKDFSKGLVLFFSIFSSIESRPADEKKSNLHFSLYSLFTLISLEFGGKGGMLDAVLAGATVAARVDAAKALLKVIVVEGGISCE